MTPVNVESRIAEIGEHWRIAKAPRLECIVSDANSEPDIADDFCRSLQAYPDSQTERKAQRWKYNIRHDVAFSPGILEDVRPSHQITKVAYIIGWFEKHR